MLVKLCVGGEPPARGTLPQYCTTNVVLPYEKLGLVNDRDFVLLRGLCKLGARAELFRTINKRLSILLWKNGSGETPLVMVGEKVIEEKHVHPVEMFGQFFCKGHM